ncbi:hypothetical protein PIB30_067403 [Stylosanthes scabra]|uniref:Polyadenylate-binding protein n=1 Tax=Stylosanthes scabra TaxID=79078 RepID=A0ABU6UM02_9FABA|nr:hypothetical protein [Stylosanthes scabra]
MAAATVVPATASLYVGDLHPDVLDSELFEAFSEFKSITSVRICKDAATGKSLCYGYVNFISHQDASRAIELKNHSLLHGKVIRVMWSRRDPDVRKSGRGNVFVKNLAECIDNAGLHDLFQKYGNILSSKVVMSEDGKSKGYGFVQFESEESANAAIEKLNGITVKDKQIYVGNFMKKSERILPDPEAKYTNLYIKNLDPDITEELLQEKFSSFGKIMSLAIANDANGMSKGFAFVNYDTPDEAKQAMEAMNGSQFGSKNLYVGRAQKKAEREQILHHLFEEKRKEQIMKYKGSNIYVKNINDSVTDNQLREHFSACGTIISAKVMQDEKGGSKGFGFVCFSTPEEANKAVNTFHGWRPNAFAPPTRPFQQSAAPNVSNNTRQHRQNRGRMNGHTNSQGKPYSSQSAVSSKESSSQQSGQTIFVLGGHRHVMEKGSVTSSSGGSQGSEMLHSMLATAIPEQQKQILGEHLYPLIKKLKPTLAAKITGMLLEMDNAELLLLLESPESLSAKVEEAVQVLKNTKVSGQEAFHPNLLSPQVAVN